MCLETLTIKVTLASCVSALISAQACRSRRVAASPRWLTCGRHSAGLGDSSNTPSSPGPGDVQAPIDDVPDEGGVDQLDDEATGDSGNVGTADGDDEGPPASRLNRARRQPVRRTQVDFTAGRYSVGNATRIAMTIVTMIAAAVPQTGPYYMYIGSGAPREGDVASHLSRLRAHPIVMIDLQVGGYDDDLRDPQVASALESAARNPRCRGVLVSIPCKTWSAARSRVDPRYAALTAVTHAERAARTAT